MPSKPQVFSRSPCQARDVSFISSGTLSASIILCGLVTFVGKDHPEYYARTLAWVSFHQGEKIFNVSYMSQAAKSTNFTAMGVTMQSA